MLAITGLVWHRHGPTLGGDSEGTPSRRHQARIAAPPVAGVEGTADSEGRSNADSEG